MAKPAKPVAPKAAPVNVHAVAVHVGDGRKIAPGDPIPNDVSDKVRAALMGTGYFK